MAEETSAQQPPEAGDNASRPAKKVDLDLDDAPFLEPEPEPEQKPEPEPEQPAEMPVPAAATSAAPSLKDRILAAKKKLIMAGAAAVLLLVIAIALNIFLFSGEKKPEPPPPPPAPEPVTKVMEAPQPPPAPVSRFVLQWQPFWVEVKDTEGAIRFLTCSFSIPTENPSVFAEMSGKQLVLRDALYYYLRNQPLHTLTDATKTQTLKNDLMTVINEHLGSGKIAEILIQNYLVR